MDRHTLFMVQGGLQVFMGFVIYLSWYLQRGKRLDRAPVWFAAGFMLGGTGLFLQSYRGILPDFIAILMGNGLFLMTYVFVERAMAITTCRHSSMWWLAALDAAVVVNFAYFTYVKPDVLVRSVEAALAIMVFLLPIWIHLLRSEETTIQPALRAMRWMLGGHVVLNLMRLVGVTILHAADAWFSWPGVITITGVSMSFLWIDWLRVHEELERHAMTDPLTGLLNRRGLEEVARRELSRASRSGTVCSALTIDVNQFKSINDTYGHPAGDKALCAVAAALTKTLRVMDVATRLGGDEFFVLLPDSDESAAAEVTARFRRAIEQTTIKGSGGRVFRISVSIGMVTSRNDEVTLADLFQSSDKRLYDDKIASGPHDVGNKVTEASMTRLSNA